ncbi:SRPBCC family protein [Kordiimonas lacus]|uniref:Uncharacterized conserved protein YndB, AHSA1/START domain n=1 Tax=Kordiimonas lacus TaxID=637679 RepID=A0A1G6XZH0_9PROT|nr:SRPBCC family protein [Kordiimonas lacus]SDD82857.1 Uncharacterized conserved protein YndB, AHSA1/START domain [Kordiimonas lacus]
MTEFATLLEPGTARLERMLPASIEQVWGYLTESEKRGKWLATGDMDLRVGGVVEHVFDHRTLSPHPETIEIPDKYKKHCGITKMIGHITAIEPPRLLAYTWAEGEAPDSEVTFELTAMGDMTKLVITHRKLPDRETTIGVCGGWHGHVDIMIAVLKGETPKPFWSIFLPLEAEYEKRLP